MDSVAKNRVLLVISICAAAIAAACIAVWSFNLTTPARDITLIINSAALPAPPTPVRPTPTVIPPTPVLALRDEFSRTVNFPITALSNYVRQGYALKPDAHSDYVLAPLLNFKSTSYYDVTLLSTAVPGSRSDQLEYGVFFWHSTFRNQGERFLALTLSPGGAYRLRAYIPFTTNTGAGISYRAEDLVPATRSLYIKNDGSPNQLRVDVHPHRLLVFVNGGLVLDRNNTDIDAYRNRTDFDGIVGLVAFASGPASGQVEFTQFAVYADVKR